MANLYGAIALIGGGVGALDKLNGSVLNDKDGAIVVTESVFAPYQLDGDSGAGESSPLIIAPDDNPGDKRWILAKGVFAGLTLYGDIIVPDGGAIRCVGAPVLIFDDTNNFLKITGCNVGVNTAHSYEKYEVKGNIYITNDAQIPIGNSAGELLFGFTKAPPHNYPIASIEGIQSGGGVGNIDGNDQFGHLIFKTSDNNNAPSEKMRITHDGKFGIGTANPTHELSTYGIIASHVGAADEEHERFRLCRSVSPTLRFHSIYSRNGAAATNNDIKFKVHDGNTTTSQVDVLILRGDAKVGVNDMNPASQFDVTGDINTTVNYKVDDVQVVSNQGAIVANATDADSVILRLNELLARCRAHGLIATA